MADPLFVLSILYHTLIMHSLVFALALLASILCLYTFMAVCRDGTDTYTHAGRTQAIWVWCIIIITAVLWGIYHYMAH